MREGKVTTGKPRPTADQVQVATFVISHVDPKCKAERNLRQHATAVLTAHLSGFLPGTQPERGPFGFASATNHPGN